MNVSKILLHQKTIVITGASSGVGRAAALEFAKHKAYLVLAARRADALAEVVADCKALGATATAVTADVNNADDMKQVARTAAEITGSIDVWINNAGVLAAGEFAGTPVEVHTQVIKTNLIGYLHGAHAVLPYFKKQQRGILINNISVGGWLPVPYATGYSASKFGLRGFSEALRAELIQFSDIHVCELYPAFLDTPGIQHAGNYTGVALKPAPPVYDPQRVAKTMVKLAQQPKATTTVGSIATLLRLSHLLMPRITNNITAFVMNTYFKHGEDMPPTDGNLFQPVEYGTSIHGGWNSVADAEIRKKRVTAAAVLFSTAAAGLYVASLLKNKRDKH